MKKKRRRCQEKKPAVAPQVSVAARRLSNHKRYGYRTGAVFYSVWVRFAVPGGMGNDRSPFSSIPDDSGSTRDCRGVVG